jgi:nucleotide-binding universal stress UspA family protein
MEAGRKLLSQAIEEGALQGVQVRGLLEAARDPVSGLLAAAESQEAESLLMGYSPPGGKEPGEEGAFDRLTHKVARETEAHLFIVKFRCPDITRILAVVDLQDDLIAYAELLRAVVEHTAAPVVFFHASDYEGTEEDIRAELEDKLEQAGLFDWGGLEIRKSGDPLAAIVERANQCDLTLINAAPRPSLMEAVFGSLPERVAAETESTVVLVRARSAEQTD